MATKIFGIEKDPFKTSPKDLEEIKSNKETWLELAKDNLNENQHEVSEKVKILKQKVFESGFDLVRNDDKFMLKFLRAANLDIEKALEYFESYTAIMKNNPDHFENILPSKLSVVFKHQVSAILETRDEAGRRIFINRPGKWEPSEFSFFEIFSSIFALAEMISEEVKTQISGQCFQMILLAIFKNA